MKTLMLGAVLTGLLAATAMAQPETQYESPIPEERTFLRKDDKYEGLTPGEGRESTVYAFQNCYKIGWIKRQRLTRTEWELAVDKMIEECKAAPLEADEKETIVEYLAANYGRRR